MSDVVTCKTVLQKSADRSRADHLYLVLPPDFRPRILPCHPCGSVVSHDRPLWEYREKDGKLIVTPSLLATDTGFHTDYQWECDYEVKPDGVSMCEHFDAINPDVKTDWEHAA